MSSPEVMSQAPDVTPQVKQPRPRRRVGQSFLNLFKGVESLQKARKASDFNVDTYIAKANDRNIKDANAAAIGTVVGLTGILLSHVAFPIALISDVAVLAMAGKKLGDAWYDKRQANKATKLKMQTPPTPPAK